MLPCLQNPTTHYHGGDPAVISGNPYTWIAKDNTNGSIKSIYDPCPYGYRVPINGSWTNWPATITSWTGTPINIGTIQQATWWPAAGLRNNNSATMGSVASYAYYWSSSFYSSPTNYYSYLLYFNYNGGVSPSTNNYRSYGFSLRCIQE